MTRRAEHPQSREELFDAGLTAQMRGDLPEAIACFQEVIRRNPRYAPAYLQLGKCELRRGRTDEALRVLQAGARVDGRSAPLLAELGSVLVAVGEDGKAERCLLAALRLAKRNVRALQSLAVVYVQRKAWGPAIGAVQQLLETAPQGFAGHFLMAQVQEALGNPAEAQRAWMHAEDACRERLRVAEDQPAALYFLGVILQATRGMEAAHDTFEAAARLAPPDMGLLVGLGLAVPWATVLHAAATACDAVGDVTGAAQWRVAAQGTAITGSPGDRPADEGPAPEESGA